MDSEMSWSAISSKIHIPLLQPPVFVIPLLHLSIWYNFFPLELQVHFQCHGHFHFYSHLPMWSLIINNSVFLRRWGKICKFIWISNKQYLMPDLLSVDVIFCSRCSGWIFYYFFVLFSQKIYISLTLGNSHFVLTLRYLEHCS